MNENLIKKMELDKISVIIPMYDSQNTIVRTLDSIKNQTESQLIKEIIVVNDGSKDGSLEVVRKYKSVNCQLPIIIIDKENGGVSSSRNAGMKNANGSWIALLDSDDEWLPDKIAFQVNIIKDNPEIDFLGGDINNKGLKILNKIIVGLYRARVQDMCIKSFPQPSTSLFKKRIFDEMGGFDESQKYSEDMNYFIKICSKYRLYHYPKQMIVFGGGKAEYGSKGLSANMKMMHKGAMKNIKDFRDSSIISNKYYIGLWFFYWMKYFRRLAIVQFRAK